MNKLTLMALAATFSLANVAAFAEGHEGKGPDGPGRHGPPKFESVDTNKDGFLTREEMEAHHKGRLDKMFEKIDADKDGKLSKEEMKKGHDFMKKKMRKHCDDKDKKDGDKKGDAPPAPVGEKE